MHRARPFVLAGLITALLAIAVLLGWSEHASPMPPEAMKPIGSVATRFSASRNGFAFINHPGADRETLLGPVLSGLCGGMSYAALDYYWAGRTPDDGATDRFLILRDAQSMLENGADFVRWTLAPDKPSNGYAFGVGTSTRDSELPALARALGKGPVPLGLVKARGLRQIGENHQVVAYALERSGSTVHIRVYDPNHPRSDDTFLALDLAKSGAVLQMTGGARVDSWRGFFVEHYSPATPPRP